MSQDDDIEKLLSEIDSLNNPGASAAPAKGELAPRQTTTGAVLESSSGGMPKATKWLIAGGAGAGVSLVAYVVPVLGWMELPRMLLGGMFAGLAGYAVNAIVRKK